MKFWKGMIGMEIRKAQQSDIDGIEEIYERVHDAEEKGLSTVGWIRGVYPTRKTAEDALERGDLFVMDSGDGVAAVAVINQIQVPEYQNAEWRHKAADDGVMVLHALAVNPLEGGKGLGRAFVAFYEDYAQRQGCSALRMDTNVKNDRARGLYRSLGYEEVGVVSCVFNGIPDVKLVCLEKYLG